MEVKLKFLSYIFTNLLNLWVMFSSSIYTYMTCRVLRPAPFKSDGPMMEIKMRPPWRQCISSKSLMSHRYTNGPSIECSRSVATVPYAYRIVEILRGDKQRRSRSPRKSNCKSFSLERSRLELRSVL